jgi:glycosyltransferase involved in cell wall biosynthesis
MKPTLLVHIDYGSQGSAGLYIERLLKAPTSFDEVEAFVHHDYAGDGGAAAVHRIFGRRSANMKLRALQGLYKWIDLYSCFFSIWMQLRRRSRSRRMVVVISLFQSFRAYEWLFRRLRPLGKLVVIVHDAVEHAHSYPALVMSPREDILAHAHKLIAHSDDAKRKLERYGRPVSVMPFPPMKPDSRGEKGRSGVGLVRFLFIGHIKAEKGVDRLVKVWRSLPESVVQRCSLTIAGSLSSDVPPDFDGLRNATIRVGFLGDEEFVGLIEAADCLLFPYIGGTNSGVYSISCSMAKPSIVSSLPVFSESPFYPASLSFDSDDELAERISAVVERPSDLVGMSEAMHAIWRRTDADFDAFFERNDPFMAGEAEGG